MGAWLQQAKRCGFYLTLQWAESWSESERLRVSSRNDVVLRKGSSLVSRTGRTA